jgi:hypothetical protein
MMEIRNNPIDGKWKRYSAHQHKREYAESGRRLGTNVCDGSQQKGKLSRS